MITFQFLRLNLFVFKLQQLSYFKVLFFPTASIGYNVSIDSPLHWTSGAGIKQCSRLLSPLLPSSVYATVCGSQGKTVSYLRGTCVPLCLQFLPCLLIAINGTTIGIILDSALSPYLQVLAAPQTTRAVYTLTYLLHYCSPSVCHVEQTSWTHYCQSFFKILCLSFLPPHSPFSDLQKHCIPT